MPPGTRSTWWQRHRDTWLHDLTVALTAGVVVSVPLFIVAARQTSHIADRQEVLENVRFIRERAAAEPDGLKPFARLNLRGAPLSGLDLSCDNYTSRTGPVAPRGCADFKDADLSNADLSDADLRGALFIGADLSGARFVGADLRGADGIGINSVQDADFAVTDLRSVRLYGDFGGVELFGADVRGADLTNVRNMTEVNFTLQASRDDEPTICHDSSTRWPDNFQPPASRCEHEEG